jgi:hypothetical protein
LPAGWLDRVWASRDPVLANRPESFVGEVLYLVDKNDSGCVETSVDQYRRENVRTAACKPDAVDIRNQPFELHLEHGLSINGTFVVGGANEDNGFAFDVILADVTGSFVAGDKRTTCFSTPEFKNKPAHACLAVVVDTAYQTLVSHRRVGSASASASVAGTAFGGNGKIWGKGASVSSTPWLGVNFFIAKDWTTATSRGGSRSLGQMSPAELRIEFGRSMADASTAFKEQLQ